MNRSQLTSRVTTVPACPCAAACRSRGRAASAASRLSGAPFVDATCSPVGTHSPGAVAEKLAAPTMADTTLPRTATSDAHLEVQRGHAVRRVVRHVAGQLNSLAARAHACPGARRVGSIHLISAISFVVRAQARASGSKPPLCIWALRLWWAVLTLHGQRLDHQGARAGKVAPAQRRCKRALRLHPLPRWQLWQAVLPCSC